MTTVNDHAAAPVAARSIIAGKLVRLEQALRNALADSDTRAEAKNKALDATIAARKRTEQAADAEEDYGTIKRAEDGIPGEVADAFDDLFDKIADWLDANPRYAGDGTSVRNQVAAVAFVLMGADAHLMSGTRGTDTPGQVPPF